MFLCRISHFRWPKSGGDLFGFSGDGTAAKLWESDDEETKKEKKKNRSAAQASNPYFIADSKSPSVDKDDRDLKDIPIVKLDLDIQMGSLKFDLPAAVISKKKKFSRKEKKKRKEQGLPSDSEEESVVWKPKYISCSFEFAKRK